MNTIVTETTEQGDEIAIDIFQKLSGDRILFISGNIDDDMAADICATLFLKEAEDSSSKITIFINSRGGDIRNALAIYDVMTSIKSPIETICLGAAMKEAVIILCAGTPGMRYATKNSVICVSQLINSMVRESDLTDAKSLLTFSLSDNKKMISIIAKRTGKTLNNVMKDFERMVFMDSKQARKYGIIDKIVPFKGI
jgi:ATP-dependent Clp protease, protease subunit